MKNFIQRGETVPLVSPTGGVKSGDGVLVGSLFGVANHDAVEGSDVETTLTGVYDLPKSASALGEGAKAYWASGSKTIVGTASGNTLVGAVVRAAAADASTVRVRLNGVTV
ncbi:DUF2190 family protein [Methylopila sp. M107]|uniref:DUF2190 family protein n=1 Tax=Methylopila sp. M107 TaxID=1101190 RepID=UPI0003706EA7|nr:DUF2190 family protein [Methylopila sp. M107]